MSFQSAASSAVWIFGRYRTIDEPGLAQRSMVVHDVERQVDDRRGEAGAVGAPDVPIVEVQAARAEDLRREIELRSPVVDDRRGRRSLCAQPFISSATCSATLRKTGSRAMASFRFRWLSSDIVDSWPSASSPSNIQPSAPDSSAYATLRMLDSSGASGFAAGPVP